MNSFFGLGPMELFVILLITLIVLGPQRLPGTIREVMKYWRYFRNLSGELTAQLGEEFKDLEDLSPQRILEDLANELDDEVEQTKDAAGVKKKPAPAKASTTSKTGSAAKTKTTKSSTTTKTSTANTKPATSAAESEAAATESVEVEAGEPVEATPAKSDATAAATASAAAAAAVAKSGAGSDSGADAAEVSEVPSDASEPDPVSASAEPTDSEGAAMDEPAHTAGANGDSSAAVAQKSNTDAPVEDAAENSILPPELAAVDEPAEATAGDGDVESTAEPAAGVAEIKNDGGAANEEDVVDESSGHVRAGAPVEPQAEDDDVEVVTERAAPEETEDLPSDAADEPPAASLDGEELDGADGDGQPQIAKRTVGSTEPAPISVNGKGVRPEDEA